ncbi:MAG: hypothetical protein GX921_08755 [Bacteroidales bacterium]|nr:hypothetical protein [Bacteroidales bacterium]
MSKTVLFNLSGHGLVDMASYDKYLSDNIINYTLTEETIAKLRGCKWYITHTEK